MSGRKHHYLPQLIQRPFAYRQRGKEFYVHAHHRTRGRFTPNTSGLGKELDFYGGPEDTSLDDAITRGEDTLAETVQAINRGDAVAPADMATLICALAFRTKSMREALVALFPALLEALRLKLLDPMRLRRDLMASLSDPKEQKRLINDEINKRFGHMHREQRAKAYSFITSQWKYHVATNEAQLVAEAWQVAYTFLAKARAEADIMANRAYLNGLAKDPAMPIRATHMANDLEFEVVDAPLGEFFILGDCGPIAMFSDGKPRLVLATISSDVAIEAVFLPVSPTRCIVGHLPSTPPRLSVADINHIGASLSLEFFVSDRDTGGDLDELRMFIGSLTPIETEDDIVRSLIQDQD
ncbi:DUF4238 domain-containing protein [Stenotrophomonas sp. CFBP 13725]|uniref:DUF4238 domain-containing protein n=1 Tax=Stenotrophomonas sp. CFBP 13725 TaxID=2775297 RepID=UPI001783B2EE|nr:DUF4238 domain-containing protein [Stenotrophomonas sp. CFBP 13725]MBD8636717.1 DUF4238 domain-containing protein [Stenotrophomonas sp. CFBP 13725]